MTENVYWFTVKTLPAGGIERLGFSYVRAYVRPYVRPSEDRVKIFGQSRRHINGRKLIFHIRIYIYEPAWIYKRNDLRTYI